MNKFSDSEGQEDVLKAYYATIKRVNLLSAEEERELSGLIASGDESARKRLIEANLRLVVKIARSFVTPDMPLVDLIQEGNVGLIKAAEKFDGDRNVRFSTYASWWIKQAITRALVNSRRAIRLPHRKEEALKRIQRTYNFLTQRFQREPTHGEIAEDLGMTVESVEAIMGMAINPVSLDAEGSEDSGSVIDVIEDYSYSPDNALQASTVREETVKMLEILLEKEKQILLYRFEFFGGEKYTLKRIGAEMGISPETVRQIEKRALRKLKESGRAELALSF